VARPVVVPGGKKPFAAAVHPGPREGRVEGVREPLLTPVAAGVAYAVAALVLSGVLSPVLTGELRGPLARPQAILPMLLVNGVWGAVCGVCALGVRRLRGGAE
jgi:hypothetical protein